MDELAEREKRDAEINRALELANNIFKKSADQPERNNDEENIDQLIDMVRSIDVESAIRKNNIIDLDERTEFAAHLEEIESKVDLSDIAQHEQDIHVDPRVPVEGRERFLRARCRVLQEEVTRLQKETQTTTEKYQKARREVQEKSDQVTKLEKMTDRQRKDFDKMKTTYTSEITKREEAERQMGNFKRENDDLKRAKKNPKNQTQNDVRLQRALDEVQRYKNEMAELVRKNRDQGTVTRHQFDDLTKETTKLKRLSSEYKSVIQKQSKLVEILRNKCTHLEAARVLEFTEEEFMRALDWQK